MSTVLPPITLSSLDVERIERLLEDKAFQDFPGREQIEAEIDRANVVDSKEIPDGVVTMNSRVRFVDEDSGREFELELVYPRDAGGEGRVSVFAPVGSALLGLAVGQSINWPLPGGRTGKLRIVAVVYQPEAAGDYFR